MFHSKDSSDAVALELHLLSPPVWTYCCISSFEGEIDITSYFDLNSSDMTLYLLTCWFSESKLNNLLGVGIE